MTQARLIHCMLLAIYKEMAGKLNLIDVAANKLALLVVSVLAFMVPLAMITCVLNIAFFKLE